MAAGDLTYVEHTAVMTLNTAQKSALQAFVDSVWNGAVANVLGITAWREAGAPATILCAVRGLRKVPPAALPLGVEVVDRE